jgi:hypothetical protein
MTAPSSRRFRVVHPPGKLAFMEARATKGCEVLSVGNLLTYRGRDHYVNNVETYLNRFNKCQLAILVVEEFDSDFACVRSLNRCLGVNF